MVRRHNRLLVAFHVCADAALGMVAFVLAYALRFETGFIAITRGHPPVEQYLNVLAARSDDPTALAGMARLGRTAEERARYYGQAFDANPFSLALIRDYQKYLRLAGEAPATTQTTPGSQVRRALEEMQRGEFIAARPELWNEDIGV